MTTSRLLEEEKKRALDKTREIKDYTGRAPTTGQRRVYLFNVSTPQAFHVGRHDHILIENTGAATLRYAAALDDASAIDWIPPGGADLLDGDTDQYLPLSCTVGTTVRITVW